MVHNHRKPLKAMVARSKTIEKTLMAMVRQPKNIQWWWSSQKPLKISNGLFKTIEIFNGLLKLLNLTMFSKGMELCCGHNYNSQSWLRSFVVKFNLPLPVVNNIHCRTLQTSPQDKNIPLCKLILRTFLRNGTSKPSLTIALELSKTIEKPLSGL